MAHFVRFLVMAAFWVIVFIPALILFIIFLVRRLIFALLGGRKPVSPSFGPLLDSDFRRGLQPAGTIIERSGIREGMRVLEIGCGSGAYTTAVARAVGERGEMYALDVQEAMLKQLERKLAHPEYRDIKNVRIFKNSAYYLPFDDSSIDLVFMVGVLQQIPDRKRALLEAGRALKPGGILAITEIFLDPHYPLPLTTVQLGNGAGFALERLLGNYWHYTARFKKPEP